MKPYPKAACAHETSGHGSRASRCIALRPAPSVRAIKGFQFFSVFMSPILWGQQGGEK